jgi:hypothetical protein
MQARRQARGRTGGQRWPVPDEDKLERALVAGMLLEVIIEAPALPIDQQLRRRQIKSQLTRSLVNQLAGRISLDRFRTLMGRLEQWFPFYYPLMPTPGQAPEQSQTWLGKAARPAAAARPCQSLVRRDLLKEWLANAAGGILPRRPQSKLQPTGLEAFLQNTEGRWFRIKELALELDIDRKTAWEYVHKLRDAGLLFHNGGRSAAVRFRLAERFLKVRLAALERRVAQALPEGSRPQPEQVAAWLAATVGEAFWEDGWPARLGAGRRGEIIPALKNAGVLEEVWQTGHQQLFRLHRQWRQE